MAVELFGFEGGNHCICHTIIGNIRDRDIVLARGQSTIHLDLGRIIVPVRGECLIDFFELATREQWIKDAMCTLFEQQGVVVSLGTIYHHCVVFACRYIGLVVIGDILSLQLAYLDVVKGHVVSQILGLD